MLKQRGGGGEKETRTDGQRGWWDGRRRIELPLHRHREHRRLWLGRKGDEITAPGAPTQQNTLSSGYAAKAQLSSCYSNTERRDVGTLTSQEARTFVLWGGIHHTDGDAHNPRPKTQKNLKTHTVLFCFLWSDGIRFPIILPVSFTSHPGRTIQPLLPERRPDHDDGDWMKSDLTGNRFAADVFTYVTFWHFQHVWLRRQPKKKKTASRWQKI